MNSTAKTDYTGDQMWREYCVTYGIEEATGICNRYLDMQLFCKDDAEIEFCKQLYHAMRESKPISETI